MRHGVEGEQDHDAGHGRREDPADVDHAVPRVADDGVDEDDAEGPLGLVGAQLGDDPAAHRVAGEERPLDAELVEGPAEQLGVVGRSWRRRTGRPWVLPWLAMSMAMTLKPIDTRRDRVWA